VSGRIAFLNARVIDPANGTDEMGAVLVQDGRIVDTGPLPFNDPAGGPYEIVDCEGRVLCPGLIDLKVSTGEPGNEHRETIVSAGRAAAAGGVTSIVLQPDTNPPLDDPALIEYVARARCDVRVRPMGALTHGLKGESMSEMALLADAGAVAFTDGNRTLANTRVMRRALSYAATFDLLVAVHCEDPWLAEGGSMNEGETATRLGLPGIPAAAEAIIVERDIRLAELTGARLHIAQISTRASLAIVAAAKSRGTRVTCAVSAAHLALNELDIGTYLTFRKLTPPLRSDDDRQAMLEGVIDGTIDAIVSSHDPQAADTKRQPFAQAAFGGAGLETLLPVALMPFHAGDMGLMQALARVTSSPARILRLDDGTGTLAKGAPADFCIFDPGAARTIRREDLLSRSKNTPFEGLNFQGRVWRTYVGGRQVFAGAS
jgi:dihydroorotase